MKNPKFHNLVAIDDLAVEQEFRTKTSAGQKSQYQITIIFDCNSVLKKKICKQYVDSDEKQLYTHTRMGTLIREV